MLESLATGVPFVSTRVGQTSEIVVDGQSGLLADIDDIEALAHAVERVRADAALADGLRSAGREQAERFSYPRLDQHWGRLLETLVHRGG